MVYGRFVALIDMCIKLLHKVKKEMLKEQAELFAVFSADNDKIDDDEIDD
jgi:hypothetical protein